MILTVRNDFARYRIECPDRPRKNNRWKNFHTKVTELWIAASRASGGSFLKWNRATCCMAGMF
jgi:hypothetical protein